MATKIVLIEPNHYYPLTMQSPEASPPLGLAYMAAVLEGAGFEVEILDATVLGLSPAEAARIAMEKRPSIVGVSAMTHICNYAATLASHLPPHVLKVTGGPHSSGIPEDLLQRGFDVAVRGEGEMTILDILRGRPLGETAGISFIKNGEVIHNPPREPLDPNLLPHPARHLLASSGTDRPYFLAGNRLFPWSPLFTTRGCPFNCYYCNKQVFGKRFSPRTVDNVTGEILSLVEKYGVREIDIYDDCFNADMRRAGRILDFIIDGGLDLKLRFGNGLRIDNINEDFMEKFVRAGCIHISYGIESGDEEVLRKIPKNYSPDTIRRSVRLTKSAGIFTCGFFILGLLGDTKESMERTIDFARELNLDAAFFSIALPYPGTRLWNMIEDREGLMRLPWESFRHAQGKVIYHIPGTPAPSVTEEMYRKAYRRFYLSPRYIARQAALALTSLTRMRMALRGILHLLNMNRRS